MQISRVSLFSTNSCQHFNGVFREVSRNTHDDTEQRCSVTTVHSIYYPNKHESEQEIRKAMNNYRQRSGVSGSGAVLDGGVDKYGNPTTTQGWSSEEYYSCERGERLPY